MKNFSTRLGIFLAAAAALMLLYTVAGFVLFPAVLKTVSVRMLTQFLGRTVTIRSIEFNPYALAFTVRGIQVEEPSGGSLFSLETFHSTFAPVSSLVHHSWVFRDTSLRSPAVTITRNANGTLSWADLLRLDWPKNLRFTLDRVRLFDGKANLRDEAVPGGFSTSLGSIEVTVRDFSSSLGNPCSFSIHAVSEAGERFSWNGTLRVHPLSSRGEIAVESIPLKRYAPYLAERFQFTAVGGELSAHAFYEVDLAPQSFTLLLSDAGISAHSLALAEQGGITPVLGLSELTLSGARVDIVKQTARIDSIVLTGGSASIRRLDDSSFNIQHLLKPVRAPKLTTGGPSAAWSVAIGEVRLDDFTAEVSRVFGRQTAGWKELRLSAASFQTVPFSASIAGFSLREGRLRFTDPSQAPPVQIALTHMQVHIGGFSTVAPRPASVAIRAEIGNASQVQISGETNPMGEGGETNLRGLIRNVSLLPLGPYSARYLGYALTEGKLNVDASFLLQGRKLSAQTMVQVASLAFGEKTESKDATQLPVRLAVFLLTDANGNITVNIPMDTTLDAAGSVLQKTIMSAILTPFHETSSFPFSALGGPPASGGEDLGVQDFAHGNSDLLQKESGKLDAILQGLGRWPELMLDIEGSVDPQNDTGDFLLLAADRARAVREYLIRQGTLDPARIFLIKDSLENVPRKGSKALLSLKDRYRHPKE